MGLFDIFKKDNSKESKGEEVKQIPTPPPFQEHKKLLKDFFNIDIINERPDEGETRLFLSPPVLGNFHYMDFHFPKDGTINVDFLCLFKKFTPEFIEFANACARTFGPTQSGEGVISARDVTLLQKNLFSRIWPKVWLNVSTDDEAGAPCLCVTLFNVAKTALIEMK